MTPPSPQMLLDDLDPGPATRPHSRSSVTSQGVPEFWPLQVWDFQRVIVNPFLFLAVPVIWALALSYYYPKYPRLGIVWVGLVPMIWLGLSGFLFQYHCCDCGHTGALIHWKKHACDAVLHRAEQVERRWVRLPSAGLQATVWGFLILFGLVYIVVSRLSAH